MTLYRALSFVLTIFIISNFSCQKYDVTKGNTPESQISRAKKFFDTDVAGKTSMPMPPANNNGLNKHNPRKESIRKPIWDLATVVKFSSGTAVLIPVHYEEPFLVKTNFSGQKEYNINDLANLLIYQDSNRHYQAEMVTLFPDSNYSSISKNIFSRLVFVESWAGKPLAEYKYESNGKASKYIGTLDTKTTFTVKNPSSGHISPATMPGNRMVFVCFQISGYNYGVSDPDNGYYWTEPAGCQVSADGINDESFWSHYPAGMGEGGYDGMHSGSLSIANSVNVYSGHNIIGNIKHYNKCFGNVAGNTHNYQVQICVVQPVPNARQPWAFQDGSGTSITGNPVAVGHTFLILTETTATKTITRNVGFYPSDNIGPFTPTVQGQLNNDESDVYDISLTITMTGGEFTSLLNYISLGNNTGFMYDLNSNNCTTFALNALASVGINLPRTNGSWLNGGGQNPGDLGEDIRNLQVSSGMSKSGFKWHPNEGSCN